jgi:hypothetical protein
VIGYYSRVLPAPGGAAGSKTNGNERRLSAVGAQGRRRLDERGLLTLETCVEPGPYEKLPPKGDPKRYEVKKRNRAREEVEKERDACLARNKLALEKA